VVPSRSPFEPLACNDESMVFSPPPTAQVPLVHRQDRTSVAASHALRKATAFSAVGPRGVRVPECGESSGFAAIVRFPDGSVTGVGGTLW
jgi:hypothetical protein